MKQMEIKKKKKETDLERIEMMEWADKNLKAAIINILKVLKENMNTMR